MFVLFWGSFSRNKPKTARPLAGYNLKQGKPEETLYFAGGTKQKNMKVGMVGAGHVATHLVKGLVSLGIEVPVVWSRTLASAQALADQAPAAVATQSPDLRYLPHAEVYLVAVPDLALAHVVEQLRFPAEAVVAHTSGAQPLEALAALPEGRTGVFYPLQTFSKEKDLDWRKIPLCVEGSSRQAEEVLLNLGKLLSEQVVRMNGPARRQLHVSAVFACNFTNHLWGVAQDLLQKAGLPVNLVEPLVQETVQKAFQFPPFTVQTGPAQRGDTNTLQAHLELLGATPQYQHLYQVLTQSIQQVAQKGLVSEKEAQNGQ
ncbi:Rossmann-like and DUF2520 domain-containing protein [Rufibacter psychrotolerans]|uniref:Rossmann-like and DUF2520 domain-containing protein n=1 Tax=Rufibacter psychrotolerans TaxID=2812556 RepID=UPI0021D436FD|nr:Rossmann-like and DUF2520 domain-containing protein [Rufibacter sp. SYSU D00308]